MSERPRSNKRKRGISTPGEINFNAIGAIRGHPLSTSALRGGGGQKSADFADKQSYRSADKGVGGPKVQKNCVRT